MFHPFRWRITTVEPTSAPSTVHRPIGLQVRFNGAIKAPVVAFQRLARNRVSRLKTRSALPSKTIFSKSAVCPEIDHERGSQLDVQVERIRSARVG